jgi:outer membrane protein OmpA-like peptidoglycan-associated protein
MLYPYLMMDALCDDAARLKGYGVGPLAPVASNDTEKGKAKKRRAELVKQ